MRHPLIIVALSALCGACDSTLAAAPDAVQIRGWLAQLDDEDFGRREEATSRLQAAGEASIDALAKGAVSNSPETAWRAGEALKQIALDGNEQTLDRVATALERVGQSGRGGMNKVVADIRVRQRQLRHDRAAAKIRQLGGGLAGGDVGFGEETVWLGGGMMMPVAMPLIEVEAVAVAVEAAAEAAEEVAREDVPPAEEKPADELPKALPKAGPADLVEVVKELFPAKPADAVPADDLPVAEAPAAEAAPAADIAIAVAAVDIIDFAGPVFGAPVMIEGGAVASSISRPESLSLDSNWRGGDKGLAALRDLPEITSLAIRGAELSDAALAHVAALPNLRSIQIQGTKFSVAALRKLHRARPAAYMFCQGEAMVGIHADTTGSCTLTSVYPGSGAADAGLQAGDKIVAIDDVDVKDFSELTISVYARGVGDKLKIEFERDGKRQTTQVELRARKVLEP